MTRLKDFSTSTGDWREQLRRNERRTKIVIALFIGLYLLIGILVDLFVLSEVYRQPLATAANQLFTLKTLPLATLIMAGIALLSLYITYHFHDKLIMLGTDYREITPETAHSLEEKQLYNVVEEMKVAAGLSYMPKVYIIQADYMNAFASGYSEKSAIVAITQGLMQKLDRYELQAVMAHELSHIRHHDIKLTLTASVLSNLMIIVLDILFRGVIYGSVGRSRRSGKGGHVLLAVILILRIVLPIITMLLILYLSRTREYMADAGSVELMRDNEPMARALLKIEGDYKAHSRDYQQKYQQQMHEEVRRAAYIFDPVSAGFNPDKSPTSVFSTHPAILDRLKALGFSRSKAKHLL
jgi:heat shock protein HtpX